MAHLLDGLLSTEATALYQRLIAAGHFRVDDHPDLAESPPMRELISRGFARERYVGDPVLIPVEPVRAIEQALMVAQAQLLDQQRMLIRAREQMELLQRTYTTSVEPEETAASVRVLTDPKEIGALSVELCLSAERDFANLETAHFRSPPDPRSAKVPPAQVLARGVRFRNIYARPVLDIPGSDEMVQRCAEGGWDLRVLPDLPMKMVLVDESAALLPLDPTGTRGALLVRTPVVVAGLRMLFELLWTRATPLSGPGGGKLTPIQDKVFRLMVAGLTDDSISRQLKISTRSVRRHISAVLEKMSVDNRITAAAVAIRDGWID